MTDFGGTTTPDAYAEHGGPALRILTDFTPATNGTVNSVSVYFGGATTSATVRPVIYYWASTSWMLLTSGAEMTKNTNAWNTQTVSDALINTSTSYGIGFWYSATQDFGYTNAGGTNTLRRMNPGYSSTDPPPPYFIQVSTIGSSQYGVYATYTPTAAASGTNMTVNVGDVWKDVASASVNVSDAWKPVTAGFVNVGDVWKTIF
jgi:hypothetical protein